MAIETYTVPSDRVVHETKVDFTRRNVQKALHVVQYDKSLPVIAVHLYKDGFTYTLPQSADVKIRWGKRDHTFVYKNVLGCNSTRQIVYFDVDEQMTYFNGPCNPILELIVSGNKAGSSSIPFEIDRNPIQNTDIESHSEYPDLEDAIRRAREQADEAVRDLIDDMSISSETLPPGQNPNVTKQTTGPAPIDIHFGLPIPKAIQSIAKTGSTGLVDTYTITYNDGTTYNYQVTNAEITGAVESVNGRQGVVTGLAEDEGYYAKMGVGYADNLVSTRGVEDTPENDPDYNPFTYRTSAGNQDISNGNAEVVSMRGNTYVKNNLVQNGNFVNTSYWQTNYGATFRVQNNKAYITPNAQFGGIFSSTRSINYIQGHKYLVSLDYDVSVNNWSIYSISTSSQYYLGPINIDTAKKTIRNIFTCNYTGDARFTFQYNGTSDTNVEVSFSNAMLIDLTLLDQDLANTTGLTPEMVLAKYPNILTWGYDAGTIVNVKPTGIKTVGFNQWDEQWEVGSIDWTTGQPISASNRIRTKNYIKIVPNSNYYCNCNYYSSNVNLVIAEYDINKRYLGYKNIINYKSGEIPANIYKPKQETCYIKFATVAGYGATYNHDICINLSWSGYRNGEYEPFRTQTRSISVNTYFPDGMNGISGVYDELRKDKYIKRFGAIDLGTLDWSYSSNCFYTNTTAILHKQITACPACCSLYRYINEDVSVSEIYSLYGNMTLGLNKDNGRIYITNNDYNDISSFKTAMSGVYLIYELATPVETPISPELNMLYYAEDFGTEEWVYGIGDETVSVPCVLKYLGNLVDKLENTNPFTDEEHQELLDLLD